MTKQAVGEHTLEIKSTRCGFGWTCRVLVDGESIAVRSAVTKEAAEAEAWEAAREWFREHGHWE